MHTTFLKQTEILQIAKHPHCAKSVQICSFFWSVLTRILPVYFPVFTRILAEYEKNFVNGSNTGKYGPELTLYLVIFHSACQGMHSVIGGDI